MGFGVWGVGLAPKALRRKRLEGVGIGVSGAGLPITDY